MEVSATAKFVRISPKKARPLIAAVRKLPVTGALTVLKYHRSKTARLLYKVIKSAAANATNNYNLKEDNLRIKTLTVDGGPTTKRFWFRSHGAADPLLKRSSHFHVVVEEIKPTLVKKPVASPASAPSAGPKESTPVATLRPSTKLSQPRLTQGLKKILTRRTTNK